jgi:carboxylate-amine ligase
MATVGGRCLLDPQPTTHDHDPAHVTDLDGDSIRAIFDAPAPLTVGIEEELMLLDPVTLDLAPRARELLERVGDDGRFKLEMPAAQLEIMSPALRSAAEATEFLQTARRDLAAAAAGMVRLACSGVHPFAAEEGELNAGERYIHTIGEYGGIARRQLVFGLQVHVAVRGADRALAVYNGMRSYLPELLALAANSPFYRGEDTGLAAIRPKLCELLPRQGVPPPIESWDACANALRWGARAGGVPEPAVWWWELRPHPRFGTLEVRVPDAQVTVADSAAIAAVVQALAAHLADRHDAGDPPPIAPTWRIEENRWQALRRGVDGTLADLDTGEPKRARERLHALLDTLGPAAGAHGCSQELEGARALVEANGAQRQREVHARAGIRGLTEWLVEGFEEAATGQE